VAFFWDNFVKELFFLCEFYEQKFQLLFLFIFAMHTQRKKHFFTMNQIKTGGSERENRMGCERASEEENKNEKLFFLLLT
jgi:hypothetical protein